MKTRNRNGAEGAVQRDLYQEVTDSILGALEKGCAPWITAANHAQKASDFLLHQMESEESGP